MKLSIGIVGLPIVGKSTLFKILTNTQVNIANYPFCTIDPNVGIATVPDERVEKLSALSKSKKKIPAVVEFYDIAGLVRGANQGEGLGNQFLSHIREVNAIVEVLRCFKGEEIVHVENSVNPLRDMDIINTELILKDLDSIETRIKKLEGEAKTGNKDSVKNLEIIKKIKAKLDEGKLTTEFAHEAIAREFQLLTSKRQLYRLNGKAEDVSQELIEKIKSLGADYVISDLSEVNAVPDLIRGAYKILNLII